jgi:hypothetical protein
VADDGLQTASQFALLPYGPLAAALHVLVVLSHSYLVAAVGGGGGAPGVPGGAIGGGCGGAPCSAIGGGCGCGGAPDVPGGAIGGAVERDLGVCVEVLCATVL